MLTQRGAVYHWTVAMYERLCNRPWCDGQNLSASDRIKLRSAVCSCIRSRISSGQVTANYKIKNMDFDALTKYVNSLINNWWMKDWRISEKGENGGVILSKRPTRRTVRVQDQVGKLAESNSFKHEDLMGLPKSTLNPDGKSRACTCGARHSMFPNTHMTWCGMKDWK